MKLIAQKLFRNFHTGHIPRTDHHNRYFYTALWHFGIRAQRGVIRGYSSQGCYGRLKNQKKI